MRHLPRTHRVSVGWLHERYMSGQFIFAHESGERMPPDIFTKMFADKEKWVAARQLVNILLPAELKQVIAENKAIYEGILEKPALVAAVPSPGGGSISKIASANSSVGVNSTALSASGSLARDGRPLATSVFTGLFAT